MSNNSVNINLKGKNDPTVNITVNEAGTISGTGSVSPVINFVATGEQGAVGAQGQTGSLSASDSVTQANMADNSVGTNEIINASVTNTKLANNSVYVQHIVDGSVSTSKIENSGVTTSKIADDAITASKLADNAITAADITRIVEDNAFTTALIAYGAVTAEEIANYNVTNPKIADNAVNSRSLDSNLTLEGETNLQSIRLGSSDGVLKSHENYDLIFKYDQNIFFKDFNDNTIFSIDQSGNITTLGTIDGVDVGTSVTANNAKVGITTAQANAITANTAKETNQTTDLSVTASSTFLRLESSDGADILLPAATTNAWGVMSDEDKTTLDLNNSSISAITANNWVTTDRILDGNVTTNKLEGNAVTTEKIQDSQVTTPKIADNSITTAKIVDGNITTNKLEGNAVTTEKIGDYQVTAVKIPDGDLVTAKFEDACITAPKIASNAVTTVKILDGNVTTNKLEGNAVTTAKITDSSVTADKLATNSVTSVKIADNAITTDKITDGHITTNKLEGNAVTTIKIQDAQVTTAKIADDAITTTKILDGHVTGNKLEGGAVTTNKIGDSQVTTVKIADGNVTGDKLEGGAVTTAKIGDNQVTTAKIADGNVTGNKLEGGAVTTAKVGDNQITTAKILDGNVTGNKLEGGAVTTAKIGDDQVTADKLANSINSAITANTAKVDLTVDGAGTIHANNVGTLNQSTTGNAATATALAAGNQTIDGDVTIGADQAGHDFTLHGATTQYSKLEWDSSQDHLKFSDQAKIVFGAGAAVTDFDGSIQATGSNLVIYNDTGNIQIGDTVEITGDLTVSGDLSIGNDAEITSVGSMVFRIDSNNNETSQTFTWKDNASDTIAALNEDGEFTMYGSALGDPHIRLHQTGQNVTYGPPLLDFYREDTLVDNADIGMINFIAKDSGDADQTYAKIIGGSEESGSGTEGGTIKLQVATHDGELQTGVLIEDGDAEDEIDVTIANGSSSLTTVAGNLNITTNIELGHASDTTIARTAAGTASIEGKEIVTINKQKNIHSYAYHYSGTSAHFIPMSGATTSDSTSLSSGSYHLMQVMPFDGRVVRIAVFNQTTTTRTDLFEMYIDGDDSDPSGDQRGTDLSFTSAQKGNGDCNADWTFSKGEAIAIRRTPSVAVNGTTITVVFEFDMTT